VLGLSIKKIARRTGRDRNTVRRALRAVIAPRYERPARPSKLDPFKDEVHRLLKMDARMPGQRIRELIAPLGYAGAKTILDDYLREVRPLFDPPRTFQRTVYRPGEICQFDLWEPKAEVPVGHGQTRRGWVVVACLGYSRAGAGALVFSQGDPGPAGWDSALSVVVGRVAADAGLGSPVRAARRRRARDSLRSERASGMRSARCALIPRALFGAGHRGL
jgi:transposase